MKVAFYLTDGIEQVVLTPETASEKAILNTLHDGTRSLNVHRGTFYECRGGWMRGGAAPDAGSGESTILVMRKDVA